MASTQSVGTVSTTSVSASRAFAVEFAQVCDQVESALPSATRADELQRDALPLFAQARAQLTDATPILSPHDRGQYEATLATLQSKLDARRIQLQGAKRFAFQRKQPKPVSTTPPSTATATATAAWTVPVTPASAVDIAHIDGRSYVWGEASSGDQLSLQVAQVCDSVVDLRSAERIRSVQIRSVSHSIILLPAVQGSVMIHSLCNSVLVCPSAHQIRIHDSVNCTFQVATKHDSLITMEHSTALRFHTLACHDAIQDFDSLTSSVNYTIVPQALRPMHPILHSSTTDPPQIDALFRILVP